MKKVLGVLLRVFLGIIAAIVLGVLVLAGNWLLRREDPAAFLPSTYVGYLQVPSLRDVYDRWLNLEAADVVLARRDLSAYRSVVADVRGLSLTSSPILRALLDVHADVMLLQSRELIAVLDLGWRGILSPLARVVAPQLHLKGFSFLNDAGTPMYRYTTGGTIIHAAIVNNVAVVSLDAAVVKAALGLRATDTGLAAKASRDLLRRIRLRSKDALRVLVDTQALSVDLLAGSPFGKKVLSAVEIPGQTMLDVRLSDERLGLSVGLPLSVSLPELGKALAVPPAPIGILRYVPSSASMLSISNVAPLADLYRIAAAFQGKDVQDVYAKADAGARSVVGAGIDELLFSWIGAEMGAFLLPGSEEPVFFARITDATSFERSIHTLTTSAVAGKDSSLVLDGIRVDRLAVPWYVALILDTLGVDAPEPYFISRGEYFFLSLEAQNLAAVARAADTGDNLAQNAPYTALSQGVPSDASLMVWYDISRAEPFFLHGAALLTDVLRLYARGLVAVRLTPTEVSVSVSASRAAAVGAKPVAGFPLSLAGGAAGDILALRFAGSGAPVLVWVHDRDVLELADAGGAQLAVAKLEPDASLAAQRDSTGAVSALWAVSPGGTVWRFGPRLQPLAPFPEATGIASPMPPIVANDRLLLFSRTDSTLVFIAPDGTRSRAEQKMEASLFAQPDIRAGWMAFYPRSFDARVHLSDLTGAEASGWPAQADGISYCAPRLVKEGEDYLVTFLTQAGSLHVWDLKGGAKAPFPIRLPGVFYANPEIVSAEGTEALLTVSQDGSLSMIGMDGAVLRQTSVADLDGRNVRILVADLEKDGRQEILLYGSGAFITGLDDALRPLPGFPVKGVTRPQVVDIDRDGRLDFVTAGLDGKIYAYTLGKAEK